MTHHDQTVWNDVVGLLDNILQDYKALLVLIERKRNILVRGTVDELRQVSAREEALVLSLSARTKTYRENSGFPGTVAPEEPLQLSTRFTDAPAEVRQVGEEKLQKLTELIEKIELTNRQNRELLRVSMTVTDNVLDALVPERQTSALYQSTGKARNDFKNGILDKTT